MKKRILMILIFLVLIFNLFGCESSDTQNNYKETNETIENSLKNDNLNNIGNYNVFSESSKLKMDKITLSELEKINDIISSTYMSTYKKFLTISDFNEIKSISALKMVQTKQHKYYYNIFAFENKKFCIVYKLENEILYYDFAVLFSNVLSYDKIFKNQDFTFNDVIELDETMYSGVLKTTSNLCSKGLANLAKVPYTTTTTTSHMTDKGILFIDYDDAVESEKNDYKVLHFKLLDGDYSKIHESIINSID